MKQTIILFFGAALLAFWGCEEEQIQLTDSGYKYVTCVDLEGNPGAPSDWIFIHAVTRAGDEILEDTRERGDAVPIQLSPDPMQQARNPFQDVLAIMSIGDSIQLEYPLDSIQAPPPDVPEGVTALTYELKVVDIMGPEEFQEWRSEQMSKNRAKVEEVEALVAGIYGDYKAGNLDIQRTESGLGYVIHEEGNGRTAELGQVVDAQYFGILDATGESFDNSYQRGQPFSFQIGMGMVIPGWDEGFAILSPGSKATLFVPSKLGYGERDSQAIPANSDLIFYVEMLGIR
jgi:FKBP-type peptidyl-prolyl cis-trans isomerase FkpA